MKANQRILKVKVFRTCPNTSSSRTCPLVACVFGTEYCLELCKFQSRFNTDNQNKMLALSVYFYLFLMASFGYFLSPQTVTALWPHYSESKLNTFEYGVASQKGFWLYFGL